MSITKVPAIASHSSARNFTPGFERNMTDDMIVRLAEKGGVIQINFGSTFLSKASQEKFEAMREDVVNYLAENNLKRDDEDAKNYIKQYISENDPFENVNMVADHIDHVVKLAGIDHVAFGSDYDGVGDTLPTGLKDVSEYPNLIFELFKRGYSEEDLEKICYKNVFRVWNKTADYAGSQN
jgi:membrane dipeptidase